MKTQKHLWLKLDWIFGNIWKTNLLLWIKSWDVEKIEQLPSRHYLVTLYEAFIRPHLDYAIIYDKPNNMSIFNKIEKLQYNAALAITGTTRGSSKAKIAPRTGLWILKFKKMVKETSVSQSYQTRRGDRFLHVLQNKIFCELYLSVHNQRVE